MAGNICGGKLLYPLRNHEQTYSCLLFAPSISPELFS
jgi:hypothetical protein